MNTSDRQRVYWRKNLWVTGILLGVWFATTFMGSFFAAELNAFTVLGFPLGFYVGAQGALVVYLVIVAIYALYMNRLDKRFGVDDSD